jgi:hypothetical protein
VRVWVKVRNPTMSGHWFSAAFASCRFEVRFGDDQVHEAQGGRNEGDTGLCDFVGVIAWEVSDVPSL